MSEAAKRQLQAVARLQDAAIQNDVVMRSALEAVARESRWSREEAFDAFREHLLNHRHEQSRTAEAGDSV